MGSFDNVLSLLEGTTFSEIEVAQAANKVISDMVHSRTALVHYLMLTRVAHSWIARERKS